ncbi:MAG TPA: hypothetical protein VHA33_17645 [Candidatus Angelobacter sp.]|jgi:hypothetical protein|nr:hypothetical protein [Candidatus Angelobacter sp.]
MAKPFSTGMFMLFHADQFNRLGGFNEKALYAEDYLPTKQLKTRKFGIVRGRVFTSNRRFRSMGHLAIVRMFLKTVLHTFNDDLLSARSRLLERCRYDSFASGRSCVIYGVWAMIVGAKGTRG